MITCKKSKFNLVIWDMSGKTEVVSGKTEVGPSQNTQPHPTYNPVIFCQFCFLVSQGENRPLTTWSGKSFNFTGPIGKD